MERVQEAMYIGPFMIKLGWIAVAIAGLFAYLAIKKRLEGQGGIRHVVIDDLSSAAFYGFMIWKFSFILFHPSTIADNPIAIVYFTGGERGMWLAILFSVYFLYRQSRRRRISFWIYADVVIVGLLVYLSAASLFPIIDRLEWWNPYMVQLSLSFMLLMWVWRKPSGVGHPEDTVHAWLWFCMGQVFYHFFNPYHKTILFGLSMEQWIFLMIAVVCVFLPNMKRKHRFNES
ncbi:hypothetical protein SAMN06295960_3413 [Paenibacillus aquistagni]|uniref:Prolipoprotein diacylglyceryl transferase n=1 Tax=Paenibacillus aquistagni TaxID=1852522 RepID=A0A1X7LGB5_9BACL|nr:hypothetical protein SAMN06295960_3413 [Paenibacillus aquistagni]